MEMRNLYDGSATLMGGKSMTCLETGLEQLVYGQQGGSKTRSKN